MTFAEIIPSLIDGKIVKTLSWGPHPIKLEHDQLKYQAPTNLWYLRYISKQDLTTTDWEVVE